jgi:alginate O-acetyltransferase complex protein AlgI
LALWIDKSDDGGKRWGKRRLLLVLGIILNLGFLAYFKYANFFVSNLGATITPLASWAEKWKAIALPLGISFYTFQGLSYLIDVYRRQVPATKDFIRFGCYLTMFPQLVAGPIVRYSSIAEELAKRTLSAEHCSDGINRFVVGLAKKVLIADTLGKVADAAFSIHADQLSAWAAWPGILCYTLQIYYDFSGYSDMAIGIGKIMGFSFPENFNYPYISRSIGEFWRRWHMSLSTWFRDYLYIPMGGSRVASWRICLNLFIVFALCGFWHGAAWGFMVWGAYYGIILVIERLIPAIPGKFPRFLQHLYVVFIFVMGWVVFRADTLKEARHYYKALFGWYDGTYMQQKVWLKLFQGDVYLAFLLGIIFATPILPWIKKKFDPITRQPGWKGATVYTIQCVAVIALLFICLLPLFGATYHPFIYFRF